MRDGNPVLTEEVSLLVDTGATYSTIPATVLDRVGVSRLGTLPVRLANGTFVEKAYGAALIEVQGRTVGVTVLFGETSDYALLGATTLEQASFAVDPIGRRLVAATAIQA